MISLIEQRSAEGEPEQEGEPSPKKTQNLARKGFLPTIPIALPPDELRTGKKSS